jgi:2-hydroxychromene-2-carboxylate isomerase
MAEPDLEFFFDPVCPFCWVTSRWVVNVVRQRPMNVVWRPIALRILNEPIGYDDRPAGYPEAHQRGLEMLRVVVAVRAEHGQEKIDDLYTAMGKAIWDSPAPEEGTFEAVLAETAKPRDLATLLEQVGLCGDLASAALDTSWDEGLRAETLEAVERAGGGVGTPILSFAPPDGPSIFGPVIDDAPDGEDALRLWDAVSTLASWVGFAELKRTMRSFPRTRLSARLAGEDTYVR